MWGRVSDLLGVWSVCACMNTLTELLTTENGPHAIGTEPQWVYFKASTNILPTRPCSLFLEDPLTLSHLRRGESICNWEDCPFEFESVTVSGETLNTVVHGLAGLPENL